MGGSYRLGSIAVADSFFTFTLLVCNLCRRFTIRDEIPVARQSATTTLFIGLSHLPPKLTDQHQMLIK